ncbi:helix-turn-helix domain-containing protein [Acuticoccus yangtzensis]|uniref:helix-turn-helix domain-containing protein n=1 Tax=Acuticoccus yangtzensis TaxID=1443441 RepID=UPI000949983F|nr:AraC family transcriptional regulator [Acuticoccus yangtzensis]
MSDTAGFDLTHDQMASIMGRAVAASRSAAGPAALTLVLRALDLTASVAMAEDTEADEMQSTMLTVAKGRTSPAQASVLVTSADGAPAADTAVGRERSAGPKASSAVDPVIAELAGALDAIAVMDGAHVPVCRDALCLAMVSRLAALKLPAPEASEPRGGLLKWRLEKVRRYVDANLGETIGLADMAAAAGLSRMHFAAQFRAATGVRPHEYLVDRRIDRACELLSATDMPIAEVAFSVGFQTQSHFTTVFKRRVRETPFRWRRSRMQRH